MGQGEARRGGDGYELDENHSFGNGGLRDDGYDCFMMMMNA
jgi:hypothetical protein